MSYKFFCDVCGSEIPVRIKRYVKTKNANHRLQIDVRVSTDYGMGDFHICDECAIAALQAPVIK